MKASPWTPAKTAKTNDVQCRLIRLTTVMLMMHTATGLSLQIRAYDPARHDRFSTGYPGNPAVNTNFLADFYDFSGVGWHASYPYLSYTLISPLHFVGANHVKPGIGSTLMFLGRDGLLRAYTVAGQHNITNAAGEDTDLFVGELAQPVNPCDNITFYPILNLPSEADYVGTNLLIYGWNARVGTGKVNAFQTYREEPSDGSAGVNDTRAFDFRYAKAAGTIDECHLEGGDSGSPSFVVMDGELYVVGVHTAVLDTELAMDNIDTFVSSYLNQITAILYQRGFLPATSASQVFRLCYRVIPMAPHACTVSWIGHRGRVYRLDATTNLLNYFPVSGLLTARVATVTFTDSNALDRVKLYRVQRVD